jgi:hypothetical protein
LERAEAAEPTFQTVVISYPADLPLGYEASCSDVERALPSSPHVIARRIGSSGICWRDRRRPIGSAE